MSIPFIRARTDGQRELRRTTILATAASMLTEDTRVAALTLNELARRVGLAKSNVIRYFETREAVLLELLGVEYGQWLDALSEAMPPAPAKASPSAARRASIVEQVAKAVATTVADRPVLAELLANTASVLEHNVSAEIAASYKRRAIDQTARLVTTIEGQIGPLGGDSRVALAGGVNLIIGGAWNVCHPSPSMIATYETEPDLAAFQLEYASAVRELTATLLTGLLRRPVSLST